MVRGLGIGGVEVKGGDDVGERRGGLRAVEVRGGLVVKLVERQVEETGWEVEEEDTMGF